jgi:sugar phosphate isomerase/epimerase
MTSILERVTYHAVYDESILSALRFAREHRFAGVQVAVETPHLSFDALISREREAIAAYRSEHGLLLSLHGPDDVVSLFASNPKLAQGIFGYFASLFAFAEEVGSRIITLHLGAPPRFGTDTQPRALFPIGDGVLHRRALRGNLARLIDLAAGRFTLCVENYKLEPDLLDELQPHLAAGGLFLCWDLAKTYHGPTERDETLEAFYWRNLEYIRQVHLHDLRAGHSHCVIGTGTLDFVHFLPRLARANIEEYCIEVRPREKALESMEYLRGRFAQ